MSVHKFRVSDMHSQAYWAWSNDYCDLFCCSNAGFVTETPELKLEL